MDAVTVGHSAPHPAKTRIATTMGKASILMEALPYIRQYRGRIVVIKYGGSAMTDETLRHTFAGDVTLLHHVGLLPVVIHGGGPQISHTLAERGIETRFEGGLRVTDRATMTVVQEVLAGRINPDIVRLIGDHGARAVGVTGLDAALLTAVQKDPALGFVGEITAVDSAVIQELLGAGFIPVVAPLARGSEGVYNVNADEAAGRLAAGLGAEKLVFLTDVEGLYHDLGDRDSLLSKVSLAEVRAMLADGRASSGMIPKLSACVGALAAGVRRGHILDGRVQHALLLEIFTPEGIGTMVVLDGD